jgi:hypothetical protein
VFIQDQGGQMHHCEIQLNKIYFDNLANQFNQQITGVKVKNNGEFNSKYLQLFIFSRKCITKLLQFHHIEP